MKKVVVIAVSWLMLTGFIAPDEPDLFPYYFPTTANVFCIKTFEQVFPAGGDADRMTVKITGKCTVDYGIDGTRTGVTIQEVGGTSCWSNDDEFVRLLKWDEEEVGNNCDLEEPSDLWKFGTYQFEIGEDKKFRQDDDYCMVDGVCQCNDDPAVFIDSILVDFQPVIISYREDSYNAAILWYLDEDTPFTALDKQDLWDAGVKSPPLPPPDPQEPRFLLTPSIDDTDDFAVVGFDIFARGFGLIATGDIDADSGTLLSLYSFVAANCNVGNEDSCGCAVFEATGDPGLLQLTVSGMLYLLPVGFVALWLRRRRYTGPA